MDKLSLPTLLLISFPDAILLGLLSLAFLGIKPRLRLILLIGSIQAIVSGLVRLLPFPFGVHVLLELAILSLLLFSIMRIPYILALLAALLSTIIFGIVEALIAPVLLTITGLSFTYVYDNSLLRFAFFVPEALALGLIILFLWRFDDKMSKFRETLVGKGPKYSRGAKRVLSLVGLLLIQNLLALILFYSSYTSTIAGRYLFSNENVYAPLLRVSAIVALLIVMIITVKKILTVIRDEIQTRAELESLRRIETLVDTIRAQRHDFGNHLQAAYGLLEVGAYQEAKDYIARSVDEIAVNLDLVRIDNLGIASLLYVKAAAVQARGVNLEIKVNTTLKDLPLLPNDANTILGNLIDNSLEAVCDLSPARKHIELALSRDSETYVFEIKNPGLIDSLDTAIDIFKPEVSTKGEGRGLGLFSVKKTVEKYRGTIKAQSNTSGLAVFTVLIPSHDDLAVTPMNFHRKFRV